MILEVTTNWPHVWMVTLVGFCLVLLLLVALILVLKLFGVIMRPKVRVPKKTEGTDTVQHSETELVNMPANTAAAIAMALHLYYADIHDDEAHVMTIKKIDRRYSPWNSKIYGINNLVK